MLSIFILVLYSLGVAPSQMSLLTAVLFQLQGFLFWGAYSGLTEYIDVSVGAGTVQWVLGWIHNVLNWRIPPTANAIMFGAPWLVRLFAYLTSLISQTWRSRLRAWLLIGLLYLGGLVLCLVTALVPFLTFAAPIYTYALVERFTFVAFLFTLFWWCLCGVLVLFMGYLSLFLAIFRVMADAVDDAHARTALVRLSLLASIFMDPVGFISMSRLSPAVARRIAYLAQVWGGLAFAPYVYFARYFGKVLFSPIIVISMMTKFINEWDPEDDPVITVADADNLPFLVRQMTLICLIVYAKARSMRIDIELILNSDNFFYPLKLLFFAAHHYGRISWRRAEDYPSRVRRPATLGVRLWFMLFSPIYPLFFNFGLIPIIIMGFTSSMALTAGLPLSPLYWGASLWPLLSFLWCQVESIRDYLLELAATKGLEGSLHEPTWFTWVRRRLTAFYFDAYLWACDATSPFNMVVHDHVVFYYHEAGERVNITFRQSPEMTDELLDKAGFLLHRFTNPNWQHYMAGLFIPILILFFILTFLKRTVYHNIKASVKYCLDVMCWFTFWLFVPDTFFVVLLAYSRKAQLHVKAYAETAWPYEVDEDDDVFTQMGKAAGYIWGLAALFRLSFLTKEQLDEFGVAAWPAMDPAARARRLAWVRSASIRILKTFDDLRLPEFIEAQWASPTADDIKASYQSLKDMGWPIEQEFIDSIHNPSDDAYFNTWASLRTHLVAVSNYRLGIIRGKAGVPDELSHLQGLIWAFGQVTGYVHTVTYNSIEAEERSTSRYFTGGGSATQNLDPDEVSDLLDGLWQGVKSQFAFSKLASFDYVFNHWEKKFNMGFGFSAPGKSGVKKQLTRNQAIQITGGRRAFMALWADTFKKAASLVPVAPVFAKLETLKEKKYLQRAVRTVVGSAITHHIMTTVFNYLPNHNYKIWDTPMKVGMSFNGQNFGRLWQSLAKHSFVWAGDMTAFDSTVSPAVLKIVAECRKKGYTSHADFHRICLLIDIAYEQLLNHPMGFKATGKIVTKEQGFTTGHSSTSPDNSLALVVTYLFAWRRVTGLRAREFYTYNTLANFGDDHVLGWEPVFGWSPEAAMRAIREIGCFMRDEAPTSITLPGKLTREKALEAHKILNIEEPFEQYWQELQWVNKHPLDIQFSFLAKIPLERTGRVNQELAEHGVELDYEFATCHDPRRLVGKITGQIFLNTHPKIRRDRMLSYMDLCAHHRDIYEQLKNAVHIIDRKYARIWRRDGTWASLKPVPTYTDVMRRWYDDKSNVKVPVYADDELDESMLDASDDLAHLLSNDGFVDNAVRFLADVPTIIAPRLGLPFWGEWLLSTYAPYFSWVYELVGFANHVSHSSLACMNIVDQTAYRICSHPTVLTHFSGANTTTLYVRHWLFCVFNFFRRTEYRATWFDLPRVLDNYIAQWAFILLGRTTTVVRGVDVDIIGLIVIAGLGLFHLPPSLDSFLLVWRDTPVVSASQVFSSIWYEFRRLVAPLGAVDTQSWIALVRNLRIGSEGVVVSAPTGVGKSTRMIADAQAATGKRIVVIQPRSVVVLGVAAFMRTIYPGTTIASLTEEGSGTPRDQIVYCTPQYFFLSDQLRDTTNTIYVLDEAHIDEPLYHAAIEWLRRMAPGYILMTATPRPEWPETRRLTTIPCKSRFSVQRVDHEVASTAEYVTRAVDMAQKAVDLHKILIFVPTLALGHTLLSRLPGACFINSKNKTPDFSKRIFISTNVADAGLTIPDVAIVLSMDVDVFVSTRLETDGMINAQRHYKKVVTSGYRSLTEQTIRQRQGRTGRTCDGAFHLFRTRVQRDDRPDRFTLQDYVDAAGPALPIIAVLVDGLQEFVTERRAELGVRDSSSPWWERIASNFAKFVDGDDNQTNHFRTVEEYKDLNNNETHLDSIETFYLDDEELPDEDIVANWRVEDPEPPEVSTYAGVPNQSVFAGVPGVAGAEWGPDPQNPQYPHPFAFPSAFGSPSKEEFEFACSLLGLHPVKTFFFIRDRFSQDPILQDVPFKMWTHIDGYGFAIAEYTKTSSTQYFERLVHSFNQVTAAARGSVIPSDVVPSSIVASGPAASTVEPIAIPTSSGKSRAEMTVDESHKFTLDNLARIWDLDGAPIELILKRLHITETALLLAWTSAPDHFFFTTTLAELEDTYGVQELSANFHRIFFGSSSGQGSLPT